MKFTPVDIKNWSRGEVFYYFSEMAPAGYSLTAELDVTKALDVCRERNIRFFPVYLWLVTKNLNAQMEFKLARKDNAIGYYDVLTPLYAHFHEESKTFSFMWSEYDDDFSVFYDRYITNQKTYGGNYGILARPETPPENAYTVSCVPWISFKSFSVHIYENKSYYFPSVEAGKFEKQKDGTVKMPLSITCHHAAADGYHIKMLLDCLQSDMDSFETYL